jgi:metal-responsive CopG/Arc/MetJ family transcriptional regulator
MIMDLREDGRMRPKCPKKVLVALPPGLLEQVDFIAQVEHRNRSDLIREALRRYIDNFKRSQRHDIAVSPVDNRELVAQ